MNRIKEVLEERGIKQTWLADKLGKSFCIVNAYVCNRRQPSLEVLFEIAEILNVDVKEDEKSSDVRSFNGKEVKIGDASNITFRNDNDVIGTKVSMTKADNNMTILHQKDSAVVNGSVKSSVLGLLDYMNESKQSPFIFYLNTKTPEFKKTLVEELISLKNADMALKNEKEKSFVLKDKVDVFSFDGKVIPFSIFESFKDYEAFDNYVNGKGLKQKFEEVHNMVDSLSQKGRD